MTPIVGRTQDGATVWWTGKSGAAFVSSDHKDAYLGYDLHGARRAANRLNRGTPLHGIYFVAVNGDLLKTFKGTQLLERAVDYLRDADVEGNSADSL